MAKQDKEGGCCKAEAMDIIEDVLYYMFRYLSTKDLLSSCSFVNKKWNRVARKFIRCHRRCVLRSPNLFCKKTCGLLQNLMDFYQVSSVEDREIPFNGIEIQLAEYGDEWCNCVGKITRDVPKDFQLKYLVITGLYTDMHRAQKSGIKLMRSKAREIEYMTIPTVLFLKDLLTDNDRSPIHFLKLHELKLTETNQLYKAKQKAIIRSLLESSPQLEKIIIADRMYFEIIPKEFYNRIVFDDNDDGVDDENETPE